MPPASLRRRSSAMAVAMILDIDAIVTGERNTHTV
jgi:hypothetical protein